MRKINPINMIAYYHERRLPRETCKRYYYEIEKSIYMLTYSFIYDTRDENVDENINMALQAFLLDRPDVKTLTGKFEFDLAGDCE